uniref:Phosphomannomutase n=1 Tax=Romanomermis culicivorax TaxID=13658 RepID=A0A915K4H5_ROMCU
MVSQKIIFLFDVDGTLTKARQRISPQFATYLNNLRKIVPLAVVSGSDLSKVAEQLGSDVEEVLNNYDYVFTENGLVAHRGGKLLATKSISDQVGDDTLQKFINFCLGYLSKIELPVKRGNFIEFRKGMINVSPIGRSCSQTERDEFSLYDKEHKIREKFVESMKSHFPNDNLQFAIGGQISIDIFPIGWDKTYCLQYLVNDGFDSIHFFGDKTSPGGNDYEIFIDSRTIGHTVTSPEDTQTQLGKLQKELFS